MLFGSRAGVDIPSEAGLIVRDTRGVSEGVAVVSVSVAAANRRRRSSECRRMRWDLRVSEDHGHSQATHDLNEWNANVNELVLDTFKGRER